MHMAIQLAPDIEASIRQRLEDGNFRNENDVVREAMHLLELREYRRKRLQASVAENLAALERGEGVELTNELVDVLTHEAEDELRRGIGPKPDVCP
jgi:putative addiction module CopG family antidote